MTDFDNIDTENLSIEEINKIQAEYDAAKSKHESTFGYSFETALADQATQKAIIKAIR